ncbi:MAG: NAD(P)H-dependent oxidoreductase subunit E [Planctomycetes bacterium]|nr:NAD(P)H-dependent oxidoreductase subunit E [Planctomycetota bacterium]
MLVQRLRAIQNRHGYLPDAELVELSKKLGVPLPRVEEVVSFFPAFRRDRDRPADVEVRVCRDMTCHLRGASQLLREDGLHALADELARETGRTIRVEGVSCLGRCDRAPAMWVECHPMPRDEHAWVYCGRGRSGLERALRALAAGTRPTPDADADYLVFTNRDRAFGGHVPHPEAAASSHAEIPAPDWDINPYGPSGRRSESAVVWPAGQDGLRPEYAAVWRYAQFTMAAGGTPLAPRGLSGKDLDRFADDRHPFLHELRVSGLLGMGGAGAPAYGKWLDVWQQPGPEKYIVCNGDESEPGTFKDREILLRFPHLVVEGVLLAGLMTGASAGYIFIRHEYHEQIHALRAEIERAHRLRACGTNIFDSGLSFPVEVFESPGGYICGEQSALLEAMEDRRAQPRNRPPELGTNGLRDKPTVVNNVETLAWVPSIVLRGGRGYAEAGWRVSDNGKQLGFSGRRLFSVSGHVQRPGVYEVPVGLPLGELVLDPKYCGGMSGKRRLKAVATSGPSGGLLPAKLPLPAGFHAKLPDALKRIRERSPADADLMEWFVGRHISTGATHLDLLSVPLDLNFFRHLAGVLRLPVEPMLGAALVVYGDDADALDQAVNFTEFYRNESCGKCVPCRLGSEKLAQLGTDLLRRRDAGEITPGVVKALKTDVLEVARAIQQTSICGLGYVAPIPLSSALAYFPNDVTTAPPADPGSQG